jgi:hypothetical protein
LPDDLPVFGQKDDAPDLDAHPASSRLLATKITAALESAIRFNAAIASSRAELYRSSRNTGQEVFARYFAR